MPFPIPGAVKEAVRHRITLLQSGNFPVPARGREFACDLESIAVKATDVADRFVLDAEIVVSRSAHALLAA